MPDPSEHDPSSLSRQVLQRLESLRRAGVDRIPRPPEYEPAPRPARPVVHEEPTPVAASPVLAKPPLVSAPPTTPAKPPAPTPKTLAPALGGSLFEEPESQLGPYVPPDERTERLRVLQEEVAGCTRCALLASTRTQTVFGEGNPQARLMFIGEAPGADEDRTGRPFVGRAGQLLNDMITKGMGLRREDVFIANVLKCRPPNNRDPQPDEVAHCRGYLDAQIAIVRPEFLCFLGRISAQAMLETGVPLGRLRGRWHRYRGIPAIVTYHPAYLLRNPEGKRDAWADLKLLMNAMGIKPPERKRPEAED